MADDWKTRLKEGAKAGEKSGEASKKFETDQRKSAGTLAERAVESGGRKVGSILSPLLKPAAEGARIVDRKVRDTASTAGGALAESAGRDLGETAGRSPVIPAAGRAIRKTVDWQTGLANRFRGAIGADPLPSRGPAPSTGAGAPDGAIGAGAGGSGPAPEGPGTDEQAPANAMPGELAGDAGPAAQGAPVPSGGGGGYAPIKYGETDLLGPGQRAAVEDAYKAREGAIRDSEMRAREELQAEAAGAYENQRRLHAQQDAVQSAEAQRAAELADREREFDTASKELANTSFDENGAWHAKSGGEKALGVIGILLGALGQGLRRKGENTALQMLESQTQRNLEAQKLEYSAKRDRVGDARNAFAMAMNKYGDARAAEAVARASIREEQMAQAGQFAAQSKSVDVQNNAQALQAQLSEKIADDKRQFTKFGIVGGGGGGGAAAPKLPSLDEKSYVRGPDGQEYYVPQGKEMQARSAAIQDFQSTLDRALELRKGLTAMDKAQLMAGRAVPDALKSERVKELESARADAAVQKTVLRGQGAMSKGDESNADASIGAILGASKKDDAVISRTRNKFGAEFGHALAAQGGTRIQTVTAINPKTGMPERKVIPSGTTYQDAGVSTPQRPPFVPAGAKR
jgi:hypothetical protein